MPGAWRHVHRGGHSLSEDGISVKDAICQHVKPHGADMTNEASMYMDIGKECDGGHESLKHSVHEYARRDATTNKAEVFLASLKRGLYGIWHNVRWRRRKASHVPASDRMKGATRYLTPAEKEFVLERWAADLNRHGLEERPGGGYPDPDMVPWCDRINALPGVCTVQSCQGHIENGYLRPGHLWLRLDEPTATAFDREAFRLAGVESIEQVARMYTGWGQEIASITFAGNERDSLAASLRAVLRFLNLIQK